MSLNHYMHVTRQKLLKEPSQSPNSFKSLSENLLEMVDMNERVEKSEIRDLKTLIKSLAAPLTRTKNTVSESRIDYEEPCKKNSHRRNFATRRRLTIPDFLGRLKIVLCRRN